MKKIGRPKTLKNADVRLVRSIRISKNELNILKRHGLTIAKVVRSKIDELSNKIDNLKK